MTLQHTPGPYFVQFDNYGATIRKEVNGSALIIAEVMPWDHSTESNANMLCASPIMLDALRVAMPHLFGPELKVVLEAVAMAEGRISQEKQEAL